MTRENFEIAYLVSGAAQEKEDWWTLVVEDGEKISIVHAWSYASRATPNSPEIGTESFSMAEFLDSRHAEPLERQLLAAMRAAGIGE